jgi:hypothetical protein
MKLILASMIGMAYSQRLSATPEGGGVAVSASPLAQPIGAQVETKLVEFKKTNFNFRKDSDLEEKNKDNPKVYGKTKRPTFTLEVPYLTKAGVVAAMSQNDKATDLIVELANEAIVNRGRGLIAEKIEGDQFNVEQGAWGITLKPDMFNIEDLSFHAIATLPKSERGAGITKEQFAEFAKDYVETMSTDVAVAATPDHKKRSPEVLAKHSQILQRKFNDVRSRKDVIQQMLGFLDVWAQVTGNLEQHADVYEFLTTKGQQLMKAEEFNDL